MTQLTAGSAGLEGAISEKVEDAKSEFSKVVVVSLLSVATVCFASVTAYLFLSEFFAPFLAAAIITGFYAVLSGIVYFAFKKQNVKEEIAEPAIL